MPATTDRLNNQNISTWHQNGPFPVDLVYRARQRGQLGFDLHNQSVEEVQHIIRECLTEGKRFRAIGSLWSLNDIAINNSRLHWNTDLDMRLNITDDLLHNNCNIASDNLVFAQCGTTVNQLSGFLERKGKSLKVSGGSNGQTIAGAISTGVHGGAIDRQCISDYVRGLHLVIGPDAADRVYLERASSPVLNDVFAGKIDSRVIRDDDLFNAAVVGLGSFGFIAAVILEVEDIFSLRRYVRPIEYNDAIQLMHTLDFEHSNFIIQEEIDPQGKPIRPYHFKTYINQYTKQSVAEVIYRIPYEKTKRPEFTIDKDLHPDLLRVMHWAIDQSEGKVIKLLTRLLQGSAMPNPKKETKPKVGTLSDIFHSIEYVQPGFSWAFGVDQALLPQAMDVFLNVYKNYKVPGLSAIKLVRKSDSTIGFTKFPVTAVIHTDGVQWEATGNLHTQEYVQTELIKAFLSNGIEFTLHWGKNGDWAYPGLIDHMFQHKDDEWANQRSRLLRYEMAEMFSNDFIRRLGLANYNRGIPVIT